MRCARPLDGEDPPGTPARPLAVEVGAKHGVWHYRTAMTAIAYVDIDHPPQSLAHDGSMQRL
jgi:hypothetical protein